MLVLKYMRPRFVFLSIHYSNSGYKYPLRMLTINAFSHKNPFLNTRGKTNPWVLLFQLQPLANLLFLPLNRYNPFMNCYSFPSSLAHWHKYSLALISLPLCIFPPIIFVYFYTSLFPFFP